ncbi:hypothetical protein EsDP_00003155 [Epichloe bromicola]|uniref:Uncharacterized protein n=1 Tax=Epichloe bromicola TaxID=79588 RepID=A0ABQ0CMY7_9HYPO
MCLEVKALSFISFILPCPLYPFLSLNHPNAVTNAVKIIKHVHDDGEDPGGAWQWWLSACGGTNLAPDDLQTAFDIIGQVTDTGSLQIPKNIKKGSGKKGDKSNPGSGGTGQPGNLPPKNNGNNKKNQCNPGSEQLEPFGGAENALRIRQIDEWPPAYFLRNSDEMKLGGKDPRGQRKVKNATRSIPFSQRVKHEELHVAIDIKPGPEFSLSWGRKLR